MMIRFWGCAVFLSAAIAALPGCRGVSGPVAGGNGVMLPATSSNQDLLYVVHVEGRGVRRREVVSIVTFPQGSPVATISNLYEPNGICSDGSGNVWVVAYRSSWNVYEFAHGGTKPIAEIPMPKRAVGGSCAVDPTTGNLAVEDRDSAIKGMIDVWPGARSGKPTVYRVPFEPVALTYDDQGNLFSDGIIGSTALFVFGELAAGHSRFKVIQLHEPTGVPGGLQFDGQYVAVETGGIGGKPRIYVLSVSSSGVQVVDTLRFGTMYFEAWFCIEGDLLGGMATQHGNRVDLWPYPSGGHPTQTLERFDQIRGMTISRASPG